MPFQGRSYTSGELQKLLGVSKQRVSNLAKAQNWEAPEPGLYYAQSVEPYLMGRNIDPIRLPVRSWEAPDDEWKRHSMRCEVCHEPTPRWSASQKYCPAHSWQTVEGRRFQRRAKSTSI